MSSKRGFGNALIYVLIIVAVVIGAQFVLAEAFGSSPFYVVVSGSMTPTLEVGDIVVIQSVPFNNIHVNDVIIYNRPLPTGGCGDLVVVHRVVGISSDGGLITQGDNRRSNPFPDEPTDWPYVRADCVRGVVVVGGALHRKGLDALPSADELHSGRDNTDLHLHQRVSQKGWLRK